MPGPAPGHPNSPALHAAWAPWAGHLFPFPSPLGRRGRPGTGPHPHLQCRTPATPGPVGPPPSTGQLQPRPAGPKGPQPRPFLPLRNPAHPGDLRVDLVPGQHPADPRLGPLRQLQRHALHRRVGGLLPELLGVEAPVLRTTAEISGAELPDDVAARPQVVLGEPALARVVGETAPRDARVERQDRVRGQRPEAHRRHVQQRHVVRLRAVRPADPHPGRALRLVHRVHRRHQELVRAPVHVPLAAERLLGVDALGPLVHDGPGVAVERPPVEAPLHEVLLELGPDCLQEEAGVPDDGVVAQHRMPPLHEVVRPDQRGQCQRPGGAPPPGRHAEGRRQAGRREEDEEAHGPETLHG
ncbi:hypothetical protein SSPIM334S_01595 [Streptomyces spiroverticillatus]